MQGRASLSLPVQCDYAMTPAGATCCARWSVHGISFEIKVTFSPEAMRRIYSEMCKRSPYGAAPDEFGFLKRIRRLVNRRVVQQVVNTVKKATLIPQAAKLASVVARKTGLPINPAQMLKGYDFAVALMTGNPAALAQAKKLALLAARYNPKAMAAIEGLRLIAPYVPAIRKVAAPVLSGSYSGAPVYAAANVPALPAGYC